MRKAYRVMQSMVCVVLWAGLAHANEVITRFDSVIEVHIDGSLTVHETIAAYGESRQIRHGIRRDFPVRYRSRWSIFTRVPFRVLDVRRDGRTEDYHLAPGASTESVFIGNRNAYVRPGLHVYELTYTTRRQLGFFSDHDELYWNVTGNNWTLPILQTQATVILPAGTSVIASNAFTGPLGARGTDFTQGQDAEGHTFFQTTRPLRGSEGLTVFVSWPKGIVHEPTLHDNIGFLLEDNRDLLWAMAALVLVVLYYGLVWWAVGRDPVKGTIIPRFIPPPGLSASAARYITQMSFDNKAFTAALLEAAVKGDVMIKEDEGIYTVTGTGQGTRGLWDGEARAVEKLLSVDNHIILLNQNHGRIQEAVAALKRALSLTYEKTYFLTNGGYFGFGFLLSMAAFFTHAYAFGQRPESLPISLFLLMWLSIWSMAVIGLVGAAAVAWWGLLKGKPAELKQNFTMRIGQKTYTQGTMGIGLALVTTAFAAPFVAGEIFGLFLLTQFTSFGTALLVPCLLALNGLFHRLLKAPTLLGRDMLDQIEGFKMYLNTAEKDELNFRNPPEKTPELFEAYLPYALALGVENAWADKFSGVLARAQAATGDRYSPSWYSGSTASSWSTLGAAGFASSLSGAFSSAVGSASNAPGSSSGGGGGW